METPKLQKNYVEFNFSIHLHLVPKMLLNKKNKANEKESTKKDLVKFEITDQLCEHFYMLHQSCLKIGATPRLYLSFLQNYVNVYTEKRSGIEKRRGHLQVIYSVYLSIIFCQFLFFYITVICLSSISCNSRVFL